MGYTMVWPCLEVKLVYVSSLRVFTVVVNEELPEDIVGIGRLLQVHDVYVTKELILLCLRPVTSALVLNKHTYPYIHKINSIITSPYCTVKGL